jgi:hypothetical protein
MDRIIRASVKGFTPEKTSISGSGTGTWIVRSLGVGYANKEVEVMVTRNAGGNGNLFGVRRVGSVLNLSFDLNRGSFYRTVLADQNGNIEMLSTDATNNVIWITGTK